MPTYNTTKHGPMIKNTNMFNGQKYASSVPEWTRYSIYGSNYRKKPKGVALLSAPTPHTRRVIVQSREPAVVIRKNFYPEVTASYITLGQQAPIDWESARREAVGKLRSKFKAEQWNVSTFVAELPTMWDWFADVGKALLQGYRDVRKGKVKKMVQDLRRLYREKPSFYRRPPNWQPSRYAGSKWLEFRYAVMPLMYDFDDMARVLYESRAKPSIQRIASGGRSTYHISTSSGFTISRGDLRLVAYYTKSAVGDAWTRLGSLNPLVPLWELTPGSFILDWFLPIGDYLGSLDAMVGVTLLSSTESRMETGTQVVKKIYSVPNSVVTYSHTAHGEAHWKNYSRTINPDLSTPPLRLNPSMTALRFFDTLALLRGNLGDIRRF